MILHNASFGMIKISSSNSTPRVGEGGDWQKVEITIGDGKDKFPPAFLGISKFHNLKNYIFPSSLT
jgi:hypothetical protein